MTIGEVIDLREAVIDWANTNDPDLQAEHMKDWARRIISAADIYDAVDAGFTEPAAIWDFICESGDL